MEFRPLRPEEAEMAAVLFDEARSGMREMGLDQWQHGVPGLLNARHDAAAGTGRALVEDGALCAVCTLLPDGEPDYAEIEGAWPSGAAPYLTVHRVTVRRACRGGAVSARLMQEIFAEARRRGYRFVRIDTHPENRPMRRMLEKNGFHACGVIHLHGGPDDGAARVAYEAAVPAAEAE